MSNPDSHSYSSSGAAEDALARSILDTVREPLIVLDADLRVKTASRPFYQTFHVTPEQTENRLLYELGNHQWDIPKLRALLEEILPRNTTFDDYEVEHDFPDIGHRVMLLNARRVLRNGNHTDFILLAIEDVTDKRQAGKALRESEKRFQSFMANSPATAYIKDSEGRYLYVNRVLERDFDRPLTEWTGKTDLDIFPPEQAEQFRVNDRNVLASRSSMRFEETATQADGPHHYLTFKFPLQDRDGRWLLAGMSIDITDRKQAEEALRASEARYRFVLDSMPQKIFTAKPTGDVDYFNPVWMEFTGLAFEQIRDWGWTQFIHPEDVEENVRVWKHSIATGEPFQLEHRFRRADGQYRWHISRAKAMRDDEGRVILWIGSNTDIHDVKEAQKELARLTAESEQRRRLYETILSNTPDLAYVFNLNHRFTYANEILLRMWGKTWDESIGKNFLELGYEPWHAALHDREIEQVIATKQPIRGEVPFTGTFGRRIYDYIFVPVIGENGEVEAVAGTTRDVTERKQMEDKLRHVAAELSESNRLKDEFLGILAHELRNPLAPLRNGLQIMWLSRGNTEAIAQARSMMERQLHHLVRLVDDLLDVSRISQGKIILKKERVELAAVVGSAMEASEPAIKQRGQELTVTLPETPVYLDADKTRLAQALCNLLNNASKYSDRESPIWLTVQREGNEAIIRVRDNGIGIPAPMLSKVFDMFTQVDRSLEKSQSGLGIGLTLARRLVEMHGGSVEAKSEGHGMGSEFILRLPIVLSVMQEQQEEQDDRQKRSTARRRILVVDDNVDAASSLAMMLKIMGHEVRTAHDGLEGVEVATAYRPDLILLDIGMPKLNGYEVCRRIREQPWGKNLFLVALTGWGQDEDRRRSQEAGFNHHLVKPVEPAALEELLAALESRTA